MPNQPGSELVWDDDMWIELNNDGTPLGAWIWNEDEEIWVFTEEIPLAAITPTISSQPYNMPKTDTTGSYTLRNISFFGLSAIAVIVSAVAVKRQLRIYKTN